MSDKFPAARIPEASYILVALLIGLFFFSINKILLNVYYSMHDTKMPMYTSGVSATFNFVANVILMKGFGTVGIALATTLSGLLQTTLLVYYLHKKYSFKIYMRYFVAFVWRFLLQLVLILPIFYGLYISLHHLIETHFSGWIRVFLIDKVGFWFWTLPLIGLIFVTLFFTRKPFRLRMHFLD